MAKLSSDGKYVTVEKTDTLWGIAEKYLGSGTKNKQLATINGITDPDFIVVGQKIYLTSDSTSVKAPSSKNIITNITFGELSTGKNTLYATWYWSKTNTEKYKVEWAYDPGIGKWFNGRTHELTIDEDSKSMSRQDLYTIPDNAVKVRFRVKPIAKSNKDSKTGKETPKWTASWSEAKYWTDKTPLATPGQPTAELDKYVLTATLDDIDIVGATHVKFQLIRDHAAAGSTTSPLVKIVLGRASHRFNVDTGAEYEVRCQVTDGDSNKSEWSDFSNTVKTIPAAPSGFTNPEAYSETEVRLSWKAATTATSYEIEYTDNKDYFDVSNVPKKETGIETTTYIVTGLESGKEYFFRVRAVNETGESAWSGIKSVVIGTVPAAPTTWSSSTTVVSGEPLVLYWTHNSEDSSDMTYSCLRLKIAGHETTYDMSVGNNGNWVIGGDDTGIYSGHGDSDEEMDKTNIYTIDTSQYTEGTKIQWQVRTAGISHEYGDWSTERTIEIYAPPTIDLRMITTDGDPIEVLTSYPFRVYALAGPNTQTPIGYHLSIMANESYETVDHLGNPKYVNVGDVVYSKYFDITGTLYVELSAGHVDLENSIEYQLSCTVAMNSGLTVEASRTFTVSWDGTTYEPNAEISVDPDSLTATVRPYCEDSQEVFYLIEKNNRTYITTDTELEPIFGERVKKTSTTTGDLVYQGVTSDGEEVYYCSREVRTPITDILLSVYRREFDGSFTELAVDLDGAKNTAVTDPHPALDYARYRIVAKTKDTGTVSYYDIPGIPVNATAAVIQWEEEWSTFDATEEAPLTVPSWTGSMLKLPYNIDVSDNHSPDIELIEYIGRAHPVSYYGTQIGSTSSWNMSVPKNDKDTLYALRRLARWLGDVYVREPSGSGYWANVTVAFSQKHCEVTIPVTLTITRVEGGV